MKPNHQTTNVLIGLFAENRNGFQKEAFLARYTLADLPEVEVELAKAEHYGLILRTNGEYLFTDSFYELMEQDIEKAMDAGDIDMGDQDDVEETCLFTVLLRKEAKTKEDKTEYVPIEVLATSPQQATLLAMDQMHLDHKARGTLVLVAQGRINIMDPTSGEMPPAPEVWVETDTTDTVVGVYAVDIPDIQINHLSWNNVLAHYNMEAMEQDDPELHATLCALNEFCRANQFVREDTPSIESIDFLIHNPEVPIEEYLDVESDLEEQSLDDQYLDRLAAEDYRLTRV